jgi:cobalt-zinc-cadmium resistance protein CzcA
VTKPHTAFGTKTQPSGSTQLQLPAEYGRPAIGPLTTGLGEVYQFTLKGPGYSPMALRTMLEWDIGMKLRAVPGVVE